MMYCLGDRENHNITLCGRSIGNRNIDILYNIRYVAQLWVENQIHILPFKNWCPICYNHPEFQMELLKQAGEK